MKQQTVKYSDKQERTYWFALLELARECGDSAKVAEARRNLKKLGVRVHYARKGKDG